MFADEVTDFIRREYLRVKKLRLNLKSRFDPSLKMLFSVALHNEWKKKNGPRFSFFFFIREFRDVLRVGTEKKRRKYVGLELFTGGKRG